MDFEKEFANSLKRETEGLTPPACLEKNIGRLLFSVVQEEALVSTWSPLPTASAQDIVSHCNLQTAHCPIV
jgi:hypothetical protein